MANQLAHLLAQWYPERRACQWVLGTVYATEGPCYRKAGAMMLFNSFGQQFGMLSGGCLESDIQQHARRVMQQGLAMTLCYDGSDEDDLSFQLGIGCGGTVYILLQPIRAEDGWLGLDQALECLQRRQRGSLKLRIPSSRDARVEGCFVAGEGRGHQAGESRVAGRLAHRYTESGQSYVYCPVLAEPHLLVCGGGIDARPLVSIAHQLGWKLSLWDPRPANARREFFIQADDVLRCEANELGDYVLQQQVDAAVLMSHSVALDAAALKALHTAALDYIALLGPDTRRDKVIAQAGLTTDSLAGKLAGPAGLDLGAELPEGIALAILAECHARLMQRDAHSMSGILQPG